MLPQDTSLKDSTRGQRLRAGWDEAVLEGIDTAFHAVGTCDCVGQRVGSDRSSWPGRTVRRGCGRIIARSKSPRPEDRRSHVVGFEDVKFRRVFEDHNHAVVAGDVNLVVSEDRRREVLAGVVDPLGPHRETPPVVSKQVAMPPPLMSNMRSSATSGETMWSVYLVGCFHSTCVSVTSPDPPPRTAMMYCSAASSPNAV